MEATHKLCNTLLPRFYIVAHQKQYWGKMCGFLALRPQSSTSLSLPSADPLKKGEDFHFSKTVPNERVLATTPSPKKTKVRGALQNILFNLHVNFVLFLPGLFSVSARCDKGSARLGVIMAPQGVSSPCALCLIHSQSGERTTEEVAGLYGL